MDYPLYTETMPYLTTEQMIEVDRLMIEKYHIQLMQMMENAGRNLAHLARNRFLDGDPSGKRVIVLAGTGGNGGGAMVAARRLHNYGAHVELVITKSLANFKDIPAHQLDILQQMNIPIYETGANLNTQNIDLILDGMLGYSLEGNPRGNVATLIEWANTIDASILALDTPSGLDTTSGQIFEPAICATATMTLALPKQGLVWADAESIVGELYLADISVPPQLYAEPSLGLTVGAIFAESDIVRLR